MESGPIYITFYYIIGSKLNSGTTEMKLQADAPIWRDGACLPRLHPRRDFFATGSVFLPGFFNYQNLWVRVKG